MEEVRKLVDECKEIGVYSIGLGTESEMYLYKGIRDVIDYISAKDFDDFWICTNGLMLNDSHIKQILESNVTRLSISLDAISPETFEKTRGKGFYRLMSNIFAFLDKREKKKLKLPVFRVTCIESNLTSMRLNVLLNSGVV
jgi:MoaA/NifB/PqqE/SkfB family radical SAM enzyme